MEELVYKIKQTIKILYKEDKILFNNEISERCLVYNFAKHFAKILDDEKYEELNLDLEYNRNCGKMKTIENQLTSYPDLILHKRGSNNDNRLVIEFKKWNNRSKFNKDRHKLQCFKNEYGYKLCMLIVFDKEDSEKVKYEII